MRVGAAAIGPGDRARRDRARRVGAKKTNDLSHLASTASEQ